MFSKKNKRSENGFAVLFAILVASLVLSVGLSIFNITLKEFVLSSQVRNSQLALYSADAGIECALYWDQQYPGYSGSVFGSFGDTLSNGLVSYWRLDDGSGSTQVADSRGNNTGGLLGMNPATDWISGQIGTALHFDGNNDRARFSDDSSLDLTEYTYSFWVRVDSLISGWRNVITKGNGDVIGQKSPGIFLTNDTTGRLHVGHSTSDDGQAVFNTTQGLPIGSWAHVAVTTSENDGRIQAYINGSPSGSVTIPGGVSLVTNNSRLFFSRTSRWPGFNGALDEVRLYNRVLTDEEITALADLEPTGLFSPPVDENRSDVLCNGADITNPTTGWDGANGWDVSEISTNNPVHYTTSFDMEFDNGRCASIEVDKNDGVTTIQSRGYNTCDPNNPRRVERALQVIY